jgi:hypothetical protein
MLLVQAVEAEEPPPLDDAAMRRLIYNFDKKVTKNHEMRIKFAAEPTKFMESEIELNQAVQVCRVFHVLYLWRRSCTVLRQCAAHMLLLMNWVQ